jgi:hypothetical protein|tara:strand:- start:285 stop:710 length:426 start_codon:yes stop_codon:yes gene_type:complete
MAEPFGTTITITGPVFDGSGLRVMREVVNRGLKDLAVFEGANKVSDELWGPPAHLYWQSKPADRHGAHTRVLKRAIGVRIENDNEAIVDAFSNNESGKPINYASKVEQKYGMFKKVAQEIERNKGELLQKYVGDALVEAFD